MITTNFGVRSPSHAGAINERPTGDNSLWSAGLPPDSKSNRGRLTPESRAIQRPNSRELRRKCVVGFALAVSGVLVFNACRDSSGPEPGSLASVVKDRKTSNVQQAIVVYAYAINLGTGYYNLQWTDADGGGGGGSYTSLNTGSFVCNENCGDWDDPYAIPRALDGNTCDPIVHPDTCLMPIQAADSQFIMQGVDSLWADTSTMTAKNKDMCGQLISEFHHLRSLGRVFAGNPNVDDGAMGTHGGATIFIRGYSEPAVHIDQRFLDSTRVSINPPYSSALVASMLLHEAAHALKYDHGPHPDLPADVPQYQRNNWSVWPFVLANYGSNGGCVHYPQ
jgi:hypothetical protein